MAATHGAAHVSFDLLLFFLVYREIVRAIIDKVIKCRTNMRFSSD